MLTAPDEASISTARAKASSAGPSTSSVLSPISPCVSPSSHVIVRHCPMASRTSPNDGSSSSMRARECDRVASSSVSNSTWTSSSPSPSNDSMTSRHSSDVSISSRPRSSSSPPPRTSLYPAPTSFSVSGAGGDDGGGDDGGGADGGPGGCGGLGGGGGGGGSRGGGGSGGGPGGRWSGTATAWCIGRGCARATAVGTFGPHRASSLR